MDFGAPAADDPYTFMVRKDYLFSSVEFTLPVRFDFGIKFLTQGEIYPIFTKSKLLSHMDNQSLSWFFGTKRHDDTFRTTFGKPQINRRHDGFCAQVNRHYKMSIEISSTRATYWIDGQQYA